MIGLQDDPRPRLWTSGFVGMLVLTLLGFANLAAFYGLEPWLRGRGLGPGQAGIAIATFTLVALVLIPPLAVRTPPAKAGRCIVAGFAVTLLALPLYMVVQGFPQILALRLLHGFGFVLTLVGIVSAFVAMVPVTRAGEAYALFGVADLLPFALLPPLLETTLPHFGGDAAAQYAAMALVQAPALLLAIWIARRRPPVPMPGEAPPVGRAVGPVLLLLAVNTAAFLAHALLFSLLKPRALELGGGAFIGLFFGLQTAAIMALRLLAGGAFDRVDQRRLAAAGLVLVALAMALLALPLPAILLLPVALLVGFGFGAALPLLNALMHRHSPAAQRSGNLNLMMMTLQLGYLLGPLLGGLVVGVTGYAGAFAMAALCLAPAAAVLLRLPR
ncbi:MULTISPECIES: MFS transporter [Roseomonadaceae]|uniref:MFS transporter n=1 Tax=Falsiroseomonas oleicola TaxID=2801474 RepID=A0ABS6H2B6_9PROT|nr:MFS transporter [Roseomonas oleicola]MBU8542526.1 MFS transporter [Roseomonas oleicola]